jgi:hypothetical protein
MNVLIAKSKQRFQSKRFAVYGYEAHGIWFGREAYGGERDILLLPLLERAVARENETERGKLYRNAVYKLLFYTYRPDAVRLLKKVHETLNALEKKRPFHKTDLFQDLWRAYNELIKNRFSKLLPEEPERLSRCRSRQRRARQSLFSLGQTKNKPKKVLLHNFADRVENSRSDYEDDNSMIKRFDGTAAFANRLPVGWRPI